MSYSEQLLQSSRAADIFKGELMPDEEIRWAGQPESSVILTRSDVVQIPVSILAGGFAIYIGVGAMWRPFTGMAPAPNMAIPLLFGIPCVLMGLYLIFGWFLYRAYWNRRTCYAVTNKRVLSMSTVFVRHLRVVHLKDVTGIAKWTGASGIGTIIFGERSPWTFSFGPFATGWGRSGSAEVLSFVDVRGVDEVYSLINRLKDESALPPTPL